MKNTLVLFLLVFGLNGSAQIVVSNNCRADISTIKKDFFNHKSIVSDELRERFPINTINNVNYLSLLARVNPAFDSATLEANGILVGAQVGNIISLKFPLNNLDNIYDTPGLTQLQVAGKIKADLNKVVQDTRVDSVHRGIGLPEAYTGKDVLIGVTDWGFDYTHPMFYDTLLENSRILAAWDQFKTSGPHPEDFAYGAEYDTPAELLAAEADTANIYSYATHGSHVAGIAGGGGAGTLFRGMAFESEFLFVTFLVDEGAVLDAWEWMYQKSLEEDKRLVINMSWGLYNTGALDGTSILSEAIDTYSEMGVLFITSGGNNGNVDFHIKKTFESDTLLSRVTFYAGAAANLWGQSIHAWGEEDASFLGGIRILNGAGDIAVESPWYNTLTTDTYIDSFLVAPATTDTIFFNLSMDESYPTNGRPQMRLRVKFPPSGYRIILKAAAESGTVHFWNVTELTTDVGNWGMPFESIGELYTAGDHFYGVGAPACTNSLVAVAAHSSTYVNAGGMTVGGTRASFSSIGPRMDDELKPDISGPGVSVASSISSYTDNSFTEAVSVTFEGRDYPFARFSGTSMSSPSVAGIAALMLQANPYLSPWQVKLILIATIREDEYTGEIPETGDHMWGWGKVNAYHAIKKALTVTGWEEIKRETDWRIYPNPAQDQIQIQNLSPDVQYIQVYDLSGQLCLESIPSSQISIAHLEAGTYLLRLVKEHHVEQQKFIIQ